MWLEDARCKLGVLAEVRRFERSFKGVETKSAGGV